MKNRYLKIGIRPTLLILSIFVLPGCQDIDHIFSNFSNRIEGGWEFDRVIFRKSWAIDGDGVTGDYRNLVFNFYEDGFLTLEYVDDSGNVKIDEGEWDTELDKDCYNDGDGGNCERTRYFYLTLYEPENGIFDRNNIWEITYLGTNKLKARQQVGNGVFRYKLRQRY